jgi:hypothetical protein
MAIRVLVGGAADGVEAVVRALRPRLDGLGAVVTAEGGFAVRAVLPTVPTVPTAEEAGV